MKGAFCIPIHWLGSTGKWSLLDTVSRTPAPPFLISIYLPSAANYNLLYFLFRTVVSLSNSLSIYVQSEGRRPDLKLLDDPRKPSITSAGDGMKSIFNFQDASNISLESEAKLSISQKSVAPELSGDSTSDSNNSESSDLEETPFLQDQNTRTRPAFNCKKRLTSHSK